MCVACRRFGPAQPFHVAEIFTGKPGKFVSLEQSVAGFKGLLEGKYDDLPEVRPRRVSG